MGGFMKQMLPGIGAAAGGMVGGPPGAAIGGSLGGAGASALGPDVQNAAQPQNAMLDQQRAAHQQLLAALMQQMQQASQPGATQMESRGMTQMPDIHALIAALGQRRV